MATPHVTAAAAMIRSVDPTYTAEKIKNILKDSAEASRGGPPVLKIDKAVKWVIEHPSEELSEWQDINNISVSDEELNVPIKDGGSSGIAIERDTSSEVAFWYLSLNLLDETSGEEKSADLDLIRTDDAVFGQGQIAANDQNVPASSEPRPTQDEGIESMTWWLHQDASQPVSQTQYQVGASGSVAGRSLNLNLVSLDQNLLYKLNIRFDGYGSISGSYESYNAIEKIGSGSCTGSYTARRDQTTAPQTTPTLKSEDGIMTIGSMESKYSIDF